MRGDEGHLPVKALLILLAMPPVLLKMPTAIFLDVNIPVISSVWNYGGLSAQDMGLRITAIDVLRPRLVTIPGAVVPRPLGGGWQDGAVAHRQHLECMNDASARGCLPCNGTPGRRMSTSVLTSSPLGGMLLAFGYPRVIRAAFIVLNPAENHSHQAAVVPHRCSRLWSSGRAEQDIEGGILTV